MTIPSHRLRVQEKQLKKKLIWTILIFLGGIVFSIYVALPLLARLAIGLSLLRGDKPTVEEESQLPIFPPVIEPIPSATNSATISIAGLAEKAIVVIANVNGEEAGKTQTDDEGKFRIRNIRLKLGENKIEVYSQKDDQRSKPVAYSVIYDNDEPKLEILEPTHGQVITGDGNITIKGETDPDTQLSVNDRFIIVDSKGLFTYQVTLSSGENNFILKASDNAGNVKEVEFKLIYSP